MNKHRKTRKQKTLADIHRKLHYLNKLDKEDISSKPPFPNVTISANKTEDGKMSQALSSPITNHYTYLVRDISKTAVLTTGILTMQLLLYILLRHHILTLPGLNY